ncbi:MAG: YdiU family protein, partial [Bdellovibrionales bacterium]|nr:YdiU family protein [Bdellovibrionales bacterium]
VNWNLQRLRDVFIYLSPNLEKDLFELNHQFEPEFHSGFRKMLLRKWGLQEGDLDSNAFLQESFAFLEEQSMDFTAFFRNLLKVRKERVGAEEEFINGTYQLKSKDFKDQARHYLKKYQKLCADHWSDEGLVKAMETTNPQYILRNYQLHQLIQELGSGEEGVLWKEIWHCLKNPYSHSLPEKHLTLAPEWAFKTPGCSTLSCSS